MFFIATAMYCEAKPLISFWKLKKDMSSSKFQIFRNENIILLITGTGKVKSAIAISCMLTKYRAKENDIFLNFGICAERDPIREIGDIVLCNKIIDADSNRSYYPDIIFKHPFFEGSIETFSKVVKSEDKDKIQSKFVDMEAYGAVNAAKVFMQTECIGVIKIISDKLEEKFLTQNDVTNIVSDNFYKFANWINNIMEFHFSQKKILSFEEGQLLNTVESNLKFSETMKCEFKNIAEDYKIREGNLAEILKLYSIYRCKSKREGKQYFEAIREKLIAV
ncbi:MAG: hypothetical protein PHX70_12875 [Clostridium sp.]|nr:hypothetical protein [Clostridium sp.]